MGLYTEIANIKAPNSADQGERVDVTVKVKNIDPYWDHPISCLAEVNGDRFIDESQMIRSGKTNSYSGHFSMPGEDSTIYVYTYYVRDTEWILEDQAQEDVSLAVAPPPEEPVLPPPEDGSIFDAILNWILTATAAVVGAITDWINYAVNALGSTVTSWITWLWNNITSWFSSVFTRLIEVRDYVVSWVTDQVGQVHSWITTNVNAVLTTIGTWFSQQLTGISSLFSSWWASLSGWFAELSSTISGYFTALDYQLEAWFTWLIEEVVARVVVPLSTWWDQFLANVFDFGAWVGKLLDAVWAWLSEDIPGHSIRWQDILGNIGDWLYKLFMRPKEIAEAPLLEQFTYSFNKLFGWIGGIFNTVFENFMEAVMGLVREIGPTNPSIAVNSYSAMAKVGMIALGGLGGMTMAGSWLKPLGGAGMGNIAAMIYDMTNYKVITGVFMGALTFAMLRQPLTYHFNEVFRPYILRIGDFMELMARDAFSHPELLREPALTASVQELTRGEGVAFEQQMIGYYGYPAQYYGLFKELSFAPLRYFPLAGIARIGYWDEAWFTEALSRSGYSPTARAALMGMYREMVLTVRQAPVMYQTRRLSREGFATMEEIQVHLEKAAGFETLTESRLYAMELEQVFAQKEMAFDIIMRSFSRGIIGESETRKGLGGLGLPEAMLDLHLMREKLGLVRRISIPSEAAAPAIIGVEE